MSLVYHLLDSLASIILLISSCDQVCNASQFASVPEGKVRLHDDDDEDFIGDFMVIKKELADVILVDICFCILLISLLMLAFVFKRNLSRVYL